jgi:hypothetical protein
MKNDEMVAGGANTPAFNSSRFHSLHCLRTDFKTNDYHCLKKANIITHITV